MNQKKNDFMLEAENPSFKTQIESKEFYKTESECIITPLFSQESQENKLFKVSLKGFFFNFQIRVPYEMFKFFNYFFFTLENKRNFK